MAYKGKFNQQRSTNSDFTHDPNPEKTSFTDLDLGVDFDLSYLDEEPKAAEAKPAAPKAPAKKPAAPKAPAEKKAAAPVKQEAAPSAEKAAGQPAPRKRPAAPVKKEGQSPEAAPKAPVKKSPEAPKAAAKQPVKKPVAPAPAPVVEEPKKKKKKGPRLGSLIFYTFYFMLILVFAGATLFVMNWLHGWLSDYELAQPTYKADQVFQQLFTDPDWGQLYESAGAQDSAYEGKEEYVNYMEAKTAGQSLNYMETSAGLSGGKKYIVRLGDEKIASFLLKDKNGVGTPSLSNLDTLGAIPDWQLHSVEVFFERVGTYRIEKLDGHTAYVNDVALDDSFTIQVATTVAESYLPEGTVGASMCLQEVTGIMELPEVVIFDKAGNQMEVSYDEATRTFTERTESNTMTEDQETVALEASRINCLWMIEEVKDRGKVAKYFDASSKPYSDITKLGELWMQGHAGYEFANESVTKFASYGSDLFSVYVSMELNVTRKDGTVKTYDFNKTLFFQDFSGTWKVIDWTNEDVSQPVGKVRLSFYQDSQQLHSELYQNDLKNIIVPILEAPEGKVFSGWATLTQQEGSSVYQLVFQPDETGRVALPEGTVLEPMTLYAVFEDASAVQAEAVQEGE